MQEQIDELKGNLKECKADVNGQLKKGHSRMDTFEANLESIEEKIDTILKLFDDFKGFFKVMGWIAKLVVWTTKISILLGAVWLIIKDHIK